MKNKILLYSVIMFLFSINSWTQTKEILILENEKKTDGTPNSLTIDNDFQKKMRIKHYHVEENVPLNFGGYKIIYNVSTPNLIQTYNLGPIGTRTITPVFVDEQLVEITPLKSDSIVKIENAKITIHDAPKKADTYVYIDIIKTYERVAGKGYESIDMLKKVGNSYFFNDNLDKAEKIYSKLFSKTTDLEPEFYYRYAISLKAVGQIDKSNEYLKKFNELSSNNTR